MHSKVRSSKESVWAVYGKAMCYGAKVQLWLLELLENVHPARGSIDHHFVPPWSTPFLHDGAFH